MSESVQIISLSPKSKVLGHFDSLELFGIKYRSKAIAGFCGSYDELEGQSNA